MPDYTGPPLLAPSSPADGMTAYYALMHDPRRTLLTLRRTAAGGVDGRRGVMNKHDPPPGDALHLLARVVARVDQDPALRAPEGDVDDRALVGHERREGHDLVLVDVWVVADAPLVASLQLVPDNLKDLLALRWERVRQANPSKVPAEEIEGAALSAYLLGPALRQSLMVPLPL